MRDESIVDVVKRHEKNILDLKSSQFIGSDSIQTYVTQTNNTWDVDKNYTFAPGATQVGEDILIKFQADNQDAPFANVQIVVLINNTYYYRASASGVGQNGVWFNSIVRDAYGSYSPTQTPNLPNEVSFYSAISVYNNGTNVKMKFKVYATDTGNLLVKLGNTMVVS